LVFQKEATQRERQSNLSWTAVPYTDTNHPGEEKGFYKIEVELE